MQMNFLVVVTVMLSLFLGACSASKSGGGLALNPTIYYKPTIYKNKSRCSSNELKDMISPEGKRLVTLCEADYDSCLMQGSCFVNDGETLTSYNYQTTKENIPRFIVTDPAQCPFGFGVRSICLDPYFSVAADLSIYQVGDVIFVPRLVGAVLPTGETHDGYLIIRDAGGGVVGANRFDFFTGRQSHLQKKNTLARLGFGDPVNSFEFRKASASEAAQVRERRHYPGLKPDLAKALPK